MASATAVLTGNTGPGGTVTALTLEDVTSIDFQFKHNMISLTYNEGKIFKLSWTSIATVTFSISGGNATVTIST